MSLFTQATKRQAKLRLALLGPAGSGKTYSALKIGRALVGEAGRIAVLDTEHGSASKYADLWQFDAFAPDAFPVETYIDAIHGAEQGGYDLLILDSLSHAWAGKGGILEFVDSVAKRQGGNSFGAWRDATPKHNELIEAMLAAKLHLIVTLRVKMEHVQEKDEKGRTIVRKIGLQPVQRDGLEYEFDVVGDLTADNELLISKTRCPALKGKLYREPGDDVAAVLAGWLGEGAPTPAPPPAPATFRAPRMDSAVIPSVAEPTGEDHRPSPPTPSSNGRATVEPSRPIDAAGNLATPAQVRAIYGIGRDAHNLSESEVDERAQALYGASPAELTRRQASEFITTLKGSEPARPTSPPTDSAPLFSTYTAEERREAAQQYARLRAALRTEDHIDVPPYKNDWPDERLAGEVAKAHAWRAYGAVWREATARGLEVEQTEGDPDVAAIAGQTKLLRDRIDRDVAAVAKR